MLIKLGSRREKKESAVNKRRKGGKKDESQPPFLGTRRRERVPTSICFLFLPLQKREGEEKGAKLASPTSSWYGIQQIKSRFIKTRLCAFCSRRRKKVL